MQELQIFLENREINFSTAVATALIVAESTQFHRMKVEIGLMCMGNDYCAITFSVVCKTGAISLLWRRFIGDFSFLLDSRR